MKNLLFLLVSFVAMTLMGHTQDLYSIDLTGIAGDKINMNNYKGRKVLIIVLPHEAKNVSALDDLVSFKTRYGSKIAIIGVPAIDEGYKDEDARKLEQLYKTDKGIDMVISGGLNVKRRSSATQADLFRWLTSKDENSHFDQDVEGVGHKFFINEKGKLYAVLGPTAWLSARMVEKIVNQP